MATMLISTSTSNTNNNLPSFGAPTHLRDVSFSSYLNPAEEEILRKLTSESARNTKTPIIFSPPSYDQSHHLYLKKKPENDGEIGVFGAEKYFKAVEVEEDGEEGEAGSRVFDKPFHYVKPRGVEEKEEEEVVVDVEVVPRLVFDHTHVHHQFPPAKQRTEPRTPSVRSDSSWNSRSGLLPVLPKNQQPPRKTANKNGGKQSFLASLGCSCSGKKSTQVDDRNGISKGRFIGQTPVFAKGIESFSSSSKWVEEGLHTQTQTQTREDFSFPALNAKVLPGFQEESKTSTRRNSLDVFGSHVLAEKQKEKNVALSLGKKLSMLTDWDVIVRREEEDRNPSKGFYDNDVESDSDLFEIESFSTNGNSSSFLPSHSQASDQNFYAPSEASIEWSVVTESAADVSDYYQELRMARDLKFVKNSYDDHVKERRRSGILSGCKSMKAVRVAGGEYTLAAVKAGSGQRGVHWPDPDVLAGRRDHHKYGLDYMFT